MNTMLEAIIAQIIARATPLTQTDAKLLLEVSRAAMSAVSTHGVCCRYGAEMHSGERVCIPSRWAEGARPSAATCGHCPVFVAYRE